MKFDFHFHGPITVITKDEGQLKEVLEKLNFIIEQNKKIMALTKEKFDEVFAVIDKATNDGATAATAIGNRITGLEEAVKEMGLPANQEADILTRLEGVGAASVNLAAALTAMGKTPETPVPVPVPEPIQPVQ